MSKYVFGIDLGTTYSCIAYVNEKGDSQVIKNSEGDNLTPSVVEFEEDNKIIVGEDAKEDTVLNEDNTVQFVKSLMGKTDFAIEHNNEARTPEEISSYILKKLAQDASEALDTEVKDVVITCPAYFGTAQRTATKNAGKIAGLNVLEVINEPTAAALFYGCTRDSENKTIMVYDLGGGTFDVTVMRVNADKIEVICSDGDHDLGGKRWDDALMDYLFDKIREQEGYDGEFDEYMQQDFRLKAEEIKCKLSFREKVNAKFEIDGKRIKLEVTRKEFDEITKILLNETLNKTNEVVRIAKSKGYDEIDEVLLVGGSTRMPQVKNTICEKFGKEKVKIFEPDEAVAKGAAIYAVDVYLNNKKIVETEASDIIKENKLNPDDYKENLSVETEMIGVGGVFREIVTATTKSFGVKAVKDGEPICLNMIKKNELMEKGFIEEKRIFKTMSDNQEIVNIEIYESDYMDDVIDVDDDFYIGNAILELPRNLSKDSSIEVILKLNKEGILEVTGIDKTSGKKVNVKLKTKDAMTEKKLEEIKEKFQGMLVV